MAMNCNFPVFFLPASWAAPQRFFEADASEVVHVDSKLGDSPITVVTILLDSW